jgi:DNA-binding PadR family transcriptional regulator
MVEATSGKVHPAPKEVEAARGLEILEAVPWDSWASWSALEDWAKANKVGLATLAKNLKRFERLGLIQRRVDASKYPPRVEYRRLDLGSATLNLLLSSPFRGGAPPSRLEEVASWVRGHLKALLGASSLNLLLHLAAETGGLTADWVTIKFRTLEEPLGESARKNFLWLLDELKRLEPGLKEEAVKTLLMEAVLNLEEAEKLLGGAH